MMNKEKKSKYSIWARHIRNFKREAGASDFGILYRIASKFIGKRAYTMFVRRSNGDPVGFEDREVVIVGIYDIDLYGEMSGDGCGVDLPNVKFLVNYVENGIVQKADIRMTSIKLYESQEMLEKDCNHMFGGYAEVLVNAGQGILYHASMIQRELRDYRNAAEHFLNRGWNNPKLFKDHRLDGLIAKLMPLADDKTIEPMMRGNAAR
jgi:hypothetical protein